MPVILIGSMPPLSVGGNGRYLNHKDALTPASKVLHRVWVQFTRWLLMVLLAGNTGLIAHPTVARTYVLAGCCNKTPFALDAGTMLSQPDQLRKRAARHEQLGLLNSEMVTQFSHLVQRAQRPAVQLPTEPTSVHVEQVANVRNRLWPLRGSRIFLGRSQVMPSLR